VSTPSPLRGILSAWFSRAKLCWGVGLGAQLVASLVGAVSVLANQASLELALLVGIVACIAAIAVWRSEILRSRAESLLRHVELEDAFGWTVEPKILADTVSSAIALRDKVTTRGREQGEFFRSTPAAGPRRGLENLRESAWWTQHLASFMGRSAAAAVIILGLTSLWSLLLAASAIGTTGPLALSNIVTAVLAIVLTANLVRLPFDYFALAAAGREYDRKASDALVRGDLSESDVLRMVTDYQLERAKAPLLPDWVWRLRRESLNVIWNTYRQGR
jgi:hypothetical protein